MQYPNLELGRLSSSPEKAGPDFDAPVFATNNNKHPVYAVRVSDADITKWSNLLLNLRQAT